MTVDHVGAYLFPRVMLLRIIGRISFPIFAFMVAEGCRYTGNKKKYLLNMAMLAVFCHVAFYPVGGMDVFRIPTTFTLSIIIIYAMQNCTAAFYSDAAAIRKLAAAAVFLAVVAAVYFLNRHFVIDYGFYGCITPAMVSLAYCQKEMQQKDKRADRTEAKLLLLAAALWLVYTVYGGVQIYAFFAIPLLWLYNGKRENLVPKHFFYIFYPLHLAVIFAIKYL